MSDRIRTDSERAKFLFRICGKDDHDDGVFASYYQALTFAAALGHCLGNGPLLLSKPATEPDGVRLDIFGSNRLDHVINLLVLAEKNDHRILSDDVPHIDERCQIFESFANAGLKWLEMQCSKGSSPLEAVLAAVAYFRPVEAEGQVPSLASLL